MATAVVAAGEISRRIGVNALARRLKWRPTMNFAPRTAVLLVTSLLALHTTGCGSKKSAPETDATSTAQSAQGAESSGALAASALGLTVKGTKWTPELQSPRLIVEFEKIESDVKLSVAAPFYGYANGNQFILTSVPEGLAPGKHTVDIEATSTKGAATLHVEFEQPKPKPKLEVVDGSADDPKAPTATCKSACTGTVRIDSKLNIVLSVKSRDGDTVSMGKQTQTAKGAEVKFTLNALEFVGASTIDGVVEIPMSITPADPGLSKLETKLELDGLSREVYSAAARQPLALEGDKPAPAEPHAMLVVGSGSTRTVGNARTLADVDLVDVVVYRTDLVDTCTYKSKTPGSYTTKTIMVWAENYTETVFDRRTGARKAERTFSGPRYACPGNVTSASPDELRGQPDTSERERWRATFVKVVPLADEPAAAPVASADPSASAAPTASADPPPTSPVAVSTPPAPSPQPIAANPPPVAPNPQPIAAPPPAKPTPPRPRIPGLRRK